MERSPRLELTVELLLLVGGMVYLVVMLRYPRNAGIVPAIASAVMIGTVLVQMGRRFAVRRQQLSAPEPPSEVSDERAEEFDGLIGDPGMDGAARRRLLTVAVWSLVVVTALQVLGFVVGGVVSALGFLVVTRQPLRIVAVTTGVVALGVYAITDLIIGIPWTEGWLQDLLAG